MEMKFISAGGKVMTIMKFLIALDMVPSHIYSLWFPLYLVLDL